MILVTGSNGFIGGNVVRRLGKEESIAAVDIKPGPEGQNVRSISCDLTSSDAVKDLTSLEFDKMVHSAAIISPKLCQEQPKLAYMTNLIGTLNMLEAARKKDVKRFVYISTGGIYRNSGPEDTISEDWPAEPRGFYSISKLTAEKTISEFSKDYGLNAVALRITAPYGRGMIKPGSSIGIPDALHRHTLLFAVRALNNEDIVMPYGGDHTVNYTYVEDIVDGVVCALEAATKGFEPFNLTSGKLFTIRELAEAFGRVNGSISVDIGPGDLTAVDRTGNPLLAPLAIKQGRFDISKAGKMLGYNPSHSIDEGAEDLVRFLREASIKP